MIRQLVILAMVLATAACAVRDQALVADQLAAVASVVVADLGELYVAEGEALIESSDSREEAVAQLAVLRQRWRPVWDALQAFAGLHEVWATSLERGQAAAPEVVREVTKAWCALSHAAAQQSVDVPPVVACEVMP